MRNLKKVLSLVLVVAMLASMLIVGAAAAEAEESLYPVAADVMTGIGVFEGDEGGYRYKDTLTREEAAKILAYVLLGADTAETLKTATAPFADVAANRWSAGYIAYLKGQGVINGVTDTTFDPTAEVTGIAFSKMLLTAIGYGQKGEFEGAGWDINTITRANQLGVYTDSQADVAAAATREECMLYAFNTMTKIPTVSYNKTFDDYYTGVSALQPASGKVDPADPDGIYRYTLAWKNYELYQTSSATDTDSFGRPAVSWKADKTEVAANVAHATPDNIFYNSVSSGAVYSTIGKTVATELNAGMVAKTVQVPAFGGGTDNYTYYNSDNIFVYVDGDLKTDDMVQPFVSGYFSGAQDYATTGSVTELYLTYDEQAEEYNLTFVIYYEHIGKVTRVDALKNELYIGQQKVDGSIVDITGIAKNDYVIYTVGEEANVAVVDSIRLAQPVVGSYTGNDAWGNWIVNGASVAASKNASVANAGYGDYSITYDSLGNILRTEVYDAAAVANNYKYLYVSAAEATAGSSSMIDGSAATIALKVVYPNGGTAVLNYSLLYDFSNFTNYFYIGDVRYNLSSANLDDINAKTGDVSTPAVMEPANQADASEATAFKGWFAYVLDDNGGVTLSPLNGDYALQESDTLKLTGLVDTDITGIIANGSTVLNIVDSLGTVVTYVGYKNFPVLDTTTGAANEHVLVTYTDKSSIKTAKTINVYLEDAYNSAAPTIAYIAGFPTTDANGYTYAAWVNGSVEYITVRNAIDNSSNPFFIWTSVFGVNTLTPYSVANDTIKMAPSLTNRNTYVTYYGETHTIDTVEENHFTTVGVESVDWLASNEKIINGGDWSSAYVAQTYYYDAETVIFDCVNGGVVTEIPEGAVFHAVCDATASVGYADANYCEYIWIIA